MFEVDDVLITIYRHPPLKICVRVPCVELPLKITPVQPVGRDGFCDFLARCALRSRDPPRRLFAESPGYTLDECRHDRLLSHLILAPGIVVMSVVRARAGGQRG